ncbi:glucose-1-phosphate adenylyltransferase [Paenibacillaceae bacterium]|nr:glucose-1-phosphate adenylyltransferase [Paenibacillaceae bacterium]
MEPNQWMAMILAGGKGTRLSPLTDKLAKPAVPFGGNYRIIDFSLYNCLNSDIRSIGVLTQYKAESLEDHVTRLRDGQPAEGAANIDLLRAADNGPGYLGTTDAIYQHIQYIDEQGSEHVLVLSGDHIYQMDYREMLDFHLANQADATISVKEVPWQEAPRFGIMNTDGQHRITDFAEKPDKPVSNLASMGVYLFRWSYLRKFLLADANNPLSSHDFGKDLIPAMLQQGGKLFACPFAHYWRDVGTVQSLWEANNDLLTGKLTLNDEQLPLAPDHARPAGAASSLLSNIYHSLLAKYCTNYGKIIRSIISDGVHVGKGAEIKDSIIMPNVRIGKNATISRAIIGEGSFIEDGAVIGSNSGEIAAIGSHEIVSARPAFNYKFGAVYFDKKVDMI